MKLLAVFTALLFSFPNLTTAQQPSPPAAQSTQRDPQAISVMSQMEAATGWGSRGLPSDALASGTVTRYRGDVQDTVAVILKAKGSRLYRAEVQDPTGQLITVLNGDGAAVTTPRGTQLLPVHAALGLKPVVFPFFGGLLSFADSSCTVQYLGTETIGTELAHRIAISSKPSASAPAALLRARVNPLTVWVSAASFLPLQIQYTRISNDDPAASRPITRTFSDYRVIGGLAFPFHQEEFASSQPLLSLHLASVSLNTGLSDAEFALPAAQE